MIKKLPQGVIISTGAAYPLEYHETKNVIKEIAPFTSPLLLEQARNLGVDGRYTSLKSFPQYLMKKEQRAFDDSTKSLAINAALQCLDKSQIDPSKINLLITVTNTQDRPLPCLSYEVISAIKELRKDINNLNLQNQGCSVLPKALDIANNHLAIYPDQYVLIVLAEAHSLLFSQFQLEKLKALQDCTSEKEMEESIRFISAFLFGDGAVAMLVAAEGTGLKMDHIQHVTNLNESHTEVIHMDQSGTLIPEYNGLPFYNMSKKIPHTGILYAQSLLDSFIKKTNQPLDLNKYQHLFIHTGSKKILNGILKMIADKSHMPKSDLSYQILRKYGNLSSVSIPMMIHELMKRPLHSEEKILALTFGVGFSGSILEFATAA